VASRVLAEAADLRNPDEVFTGGLLHDIGKLVVVVHYPDKYSAVVNEVQHTGAPMVESERKVFGYDHCQVGSALAAQWRFPADTAQMIGAHHLADGTAPARKDIAAVHMATSSAWPRARFGRREETGDRQRKGLGNAGLESQQPRTRHGQDREALRGKHGNPGNVAVRGNLMQEIRDMAVDSGDHRTMQKRVQYLDEQNRALVAIQDKLERLSDFRSDMILSHDIPEILHSGIARFQELVKTEACSVFLVDENGFEFLHEISIPERVGALMEKEIDAQIMSGTFGWIISSGTPACVPAEVFGKTESRRLSVMIAPLSNKERTLGAATIVFEQDEDFIRQQTLKLLYILSGFFSLSLENAYLFEDLKKSYFDTIRAVANSVEARDAYTRGHSNRVAAISKIIAAEMGWGRRDLEMIDWGGVLHDLGKVGITDTILNKPGSSRMRNSRS
jgi:HD-GYP domain-containing protein (c-di-GMP phosphodiesterase class II)